MNDKELRQLEEKTSFFGRMKTLFKPDDVFWNNEIKANVFSAFVLLMVELVILISWLLASIGIFDVPAGQMRITAICESAVLVISIAVARYFKGTKPWIKYMLCLASLYAAIAMCSILNIFTTLIIAVPIIMSVRYYSRTFTKNISIASIAGMAISELIFGLNGMLNLNLISVRDVTLHIGTDQGLREAILQQYTFDKWQYILNLFRGSFAPRLLLLSVIIVVCVEVARRTHELVEDQADISAKAESVKQELDMAKGIQASVLPKEYPAFPNRDEFEIYATMTPAKAVGGDFYDYYLLDDDHLAIVIADVSGKGVPAALFMMIAKALIKTHAYDTKDPLKTIEKVNDILCEDNGMEMFVTVWLGIIDLKSGVMKYVNAGHENPAVKRADGSYEIVVERHDLVVGAMDGIAFHEHEIILNPGDQLFVYTDGVTEATDALYKLFGESRTIEALDKHSSEPITEMLNSVKGEIDSFVGDAPQFDDITMVAFRYLKNME